MTTNNKTARRKVAHLLAATVVALVLGGCGKDGRANLGATQPTSSQAATAAPDGTLLAVTTDGKPLAIKSAGSSCALGGNDVRRRLGLGVANPSARAPGTITVIPAFAVPKLVSSGNTPANSSRLVVVDMACHESATLSTYETRPPESWYPTLSEAVKLGYMDVREQDGKWGSWNLRTNQWDPAPCCAMPAHSLIRARWQRNYDGQNATAAPSWPYVWEIMRPVAWVYGAVALVCVLIAIGVGHRGAAVVGQGLVVMPLRAVWLAVVIVFAANVYALAGMLRSGALGAIASGTVYNATKAWRR